MPVVAPVGLGLLVAPVGLLVAPGQEQEPEQAPVVQLAPVQLPAVRRLVPQQVWPAALPG